MLQNPNCPDGVERSIRKRHGGGGGPHEGLVEIAARRRRDVQGRVIRHDILQVAPARADFQDTLRAQIVPLCEFLDVIFNPKGFGRSFRYSFVQGEFRWHLLDFCRRRLICLIVKISHLF